MALTKAGSQVWNANTLTADAGDEESGDIDFTGCYGGTVNIKITNGGTAPTIGAECQLEVSYATGTAQDWYAFGGPLKAGVDNSGVYSWGGIEVPIGVMYMRALAGSNTDEDVTIDIDVTKVTSLS